MNVLAHVKGFGRSTALRALLVALVSSLPALARAETVLYTANGLVSVTGGAPIYNGRYVFKQSDFGFFWLDTITLLPGHVQAESKCGGFQPPSDTDLYVVGDCNGITNISSSGNVVLVRQFSGQCGATIHFCNGPRDDGHIRFTFALGTFAYLGDQGEIPDSTQTTDLAGRTWTLQPADAGGRNFVWQGSGQPTMPPTANATATNVSAGSRSDKNNYYGDKWQLQDTSSQAPTSVTWDFNYTGSFAADESGTEGASGTVVGYFPCDPKGVPSGDIRSGTNCRQSLGLANPPGQGNYQFAMRSANSFGPSANTFASASLSVACPQASIAGYAGFSGTCAKTGGTLTLAAGGNADASASKGNLGEASFAWGFTFPSGAPVGLQGQSVPVPDGTNGFTLTITFPGGYQATAGGAVTLTGSSFVADFSSPSPVVRGSSFNLTNQMQKPPSTTLNSVDYLINPGSCGAPPPIPTQPLAASFLNVGGTAPATAPSPAGSYCIFLRFNYTPQFGSPTSQVVAHPLTVNDWSPIPAIVVYLDSGRTQPVQFFGSFFLTAGTTYYLFDVEPAPPAGVTYPGAQWSLVTPTPTGVALGATATQTPLPTIFSKACASGCFVKLVVGGVTQQVPVVISPCTPDATTLCLNGSRFNVRVTWATAAGQSGAGQAVAVTGDTGYLWFFTPSNVEMILKVVDGRAVNGAFWFFAGGLTDVAVNITVTDTQTGIVKLYQNPQGKPFQPIQDTVTFVASTSPDPASTNEPVVSSELSQDSSADAACTVNATTLCLNKSRFKVQTQWTTSDARAGAGQAVALTGDTGYFWFFSENNVEMVVKVVDGCGFNANYWVFAGGLTDVNVVMTITDTQTGAVRTYTNPQGVAFQPIQDTSAFASCP